MCYDEGTLQAYLDRELSGQKRWEIEAHIAKCNSCKVRLTGLQDTNSATRSTLSLLSRNLNVDKTATDEAWHRLVKDRRFGMPSSKKGVSGMSNSRLRAALIPVAAVAVIAIALSFAPVRQAAANLLNVFRVEKVQPVDISARDVGEIQKEMQKIGGPNGGNLNIKNFGKIETNFDGRAPQTTTLEGAQKAVDFTLRLPDRMEGCGAPSYLVQKASTTKITPDVDKVNALLKAFGATKMLPAELNGKTFTIKQYAFVNTNYPRTDVTPITIGQTRSPELTFPDGVDPNQVRDVLLSLPVLPDGIKEQLEKIEDWTHTLPVPNVEGYTKTEKVTVDGVDGVFTKTQKTPDGRAMDEGGLVWQKNGIIYFIAGEKLNLNTAQAIAASMR